MRNGRPGEEESIALRGEVRVDFNVIASDHHAVVSIYTGMECSAVGVGTSAK